MDCLNWTRVAHGDLHRFAVRTLEAAGLAREKAETVADALVQADARGAASHGVIRLPSLVARLTDGGANVAAMPQVVSDAPAMAVIDAHGALGPVAAAFGMTVAIEKARAVNFHPEVTQVFHRELTHL